LNLRQHTSDDPRIRPIYRELTGWTEGGFIERLSVIPDGAKGRLRGVLEAGAYAAFPRPDVAWTSGGVFVAPWVWSHFGPIRTPLVMDTDSTLEQQEAHASIYYGRPPKTGARRALARLQERAMWSKVSLFTPWSGWAADSLRRQGVADNRIRILAPGVNLEQWKPRPELRGKRGNRLRLLFVGADFTRKGGHLLLDVFRARFADRCELNIVTRDEVPTVPGVRVHRAEPNSQLLRELYGRADLFVLPTRADCFGIATVEALASGLPVIFSRVGGAEDIVQPGETGWLITPDECALVDALEEALRLRDQLPMMGKRARAVAEDRFDGRRNDALLVDLLLEQTARAAHARRRRAP